MGPGSAAEVSVINTSFLRNLPTEPFVQPSVPGYSFFDVPCYAFLIKHPSGKKALFDLGLRKDWRSLSPTILGGLEQFHIGIEPQHAVTDALSHEGIMPQDIDSVILRSVPFRNDFSIIRS